MGQSNNDLNTLHAFRNEMLLKSAAGKYYTTLYYKHGFELTNLFFNNQKLQEKGNNLIHKILPAIVSLLAKREAILRKEAIQETIELIDALIISASPTLQQDLRMLKQDIQSGVIFNTFKVKIQK